MPPANDPYRVLTSETERKSTFIWKLILIVCYVLFFPVVLLLIYVNNNIIRFNILTALIATTVIFNIIIIYIKFFRLSGKNS